MNLTLKAWASALFTVLSVLVPMIAVAPLTPTEWVNVGLLALSTVLVAVVPNLSEGVAKFAKTFIATATTVGTLLVSFFADGSYAISSSEWIQVVAVVLAAVGVNRLAGPLWSGTVVTAKQLRSTP